jgi:hypothetical protein
MKSIALLACALLLGVVQFVYGDEPTSVAGSKLTVECDRTVSINGFDQIQRQVFGLTAYEAPNFVRTPEGAHFFSEWGVECVGMAGAFQWVFPKSPAPMDAAGLDAWFADAKGAQWFMTQYPGPDRYPVGSIVPLLVADGVEPFVYLTGVVPGSADANHVPGDFELWGKFAGQYINALKEIEPKLEFVHVTNEPNVFWFKSHKGGKDYVQLFNAAANAIHEKHPDVQVGGPVLCWPPTWPAHQKGQKDWYSWESWSKPVIDGCGKNLDFFDWHCYDVAPQAIEGELHIVTAYAKLTQDRWLRNAITELNYSLTRAQWTDRATQYRKRTLPMMQEFMMALRNPDKLLNQQVHDFNAWAGDSGNYRWRPFGDMKVTPMMELYKIFKPLRGMRLVVGATPSQIMVEAATQGNQLTIAVANLGSAPWTGPLALEKLAPSQVRTISAWTLDVASLRPLADVRLNSEITFAPESLTVITCELARPMELKTRLSREEFFADAVMKSIPADGMLKLTFPVKAGVASGCESASLRLGFKGPSAEMNWTLEIGGKVIPFGKPGPFVELRLPEVPPVLPVEVTLRREGEIQDRDRVNLLSFASLVLDKTEKR